MTKQDREFAKSRIKYLLLTDNYLDRHDRESLEMAIQALSQEPCTDAVRVVDNLKKYVNGKENTEKVEINVLQLNRIIKAIEQLPSVTQKSGKWIPVSERLPEDGTYLVTVKRITSHPNVDIDSFAKDLYKVDEFDFCDKKGKCGWYNYDSEYGYWEDDKVIAWMPLPKPYEPQESEE